MDEKEYEKFMAYLYNEYVRSRSHRRFGKRIHPGNWDHLLGWGQERLVNASNLLHYINHQCHDEDEIYRTITKERIAQLLDEIHTGARANRKILEGLSDNPGHPLSTSPLLRQS